MSNFGQKIEHYNDISQSVQLFLCSLINTVRLPTHNGYIRPFTSYDATRKSHKAEISFHENRLLHTLYF